ncbi:MAG: hypothetical protein NZ482_08710 [Gloeomargarita sp. SKYG98]|nr:hypothetical protein [Gloeomargarita sp. SKYG98]
MPRGGGFIGGLLDQGGRARGEIEHKLLQGLVWEFAFESDPVIEHAKGDTWVGAGLKFDMKEQVWGLEQDERVRLDGVYSQFAGG